MGEYPNRVYHNVGGQRVSNRVSELLPVWVAPDAQALAIYQGQGCGRELGCISAKGRFPPFLGGPLFQVNGRRHLTVLVSSG